MPSRGRAAYTTVEVKPESVTSRSNIAPSSPGSPKKVSFAPSAKAEARTLNPAEAWSLYHFEAHARQCAECHNPLDVHLTGRRLCPAGHALAQDVAEHVYRKDGVVYSRKQDNHKLVQVDLPVDYTQVPQVLRVMERGLRTSARTVPIISYDPSYPVSARRSAPEPEEDDDDEPTKVIYEPARTETKRRSTKHKSTRYSTIVVDEDISRSKPAPTQTTTTTTKQERRGSLYDDDMRRQRRKAYEVEIREPERKERRRDRERTSEQTERRKSGYYV